MTDTLFCDISEFQKVVTDAYPYRWLSMRSNDGTYRDAHFAQNHAWAKANATSRLDGFIAYVVYRPGVDWVGTLKSQVGIPDARLVVMVDVESWSGAIAGDHSADINAGVSEIASWLGSIDRVLGYGNVGDLNSIWPTRNLAANHLVVADYGANPKYPGQLIHQYEDNASVQPFGGPVDLNSADGLTSAQLCAALGLPKPGSTVAPAPVKATPAPAASKLAVDGKLGPATITRWQQIMGTTVDGTISTTGSTLVEAVQRKLNASTDYDWQGKALMVDGLGASLAQNGTKTRTIWALQNYLGIKPPMQDGTLSTPTSATVKALQARLNTGKF